MTARGSKLPADPSRGRSRLSEKRRQEASTDHKQTTFFRR